MPSLIELARHPAPGLRSHPTSGLSFPWAEYHPDPSTGSSTHSFGSDGVVVGMKIIIFWDDLPRACQEILGFSYRDASRLTPRGTPWLRRKLPWQHPVWNQLYVKRISEVRGIRPQGKRFTSLLVAVLTSAGQGVPFGGDGSLPNLGPQTDFFLAELTLHFWRPPYYVRSDAAVVSPTTGNPQEWLRYVSKNWEMSLNMLSREGGTFKWLPGIQPPAAADYFPGSVGQPLTHFKVSRTWYQIPEQALFSSIAGGPPEGLPRNMVYTQTAAENPLSKFDRALGSTQTTFTTNTQTTISSTQTTIVNPTATRTTIQTTVPNSSQLLAAAGYIYPASSPLGGCVNAPIGGGFAVDALGNWVDNTSASRLWGCYTGTLRFDGVTFTPQPLQLPPDLMLIPRLGTVEALAQQQYDVTFHFDLFDPPAGSTYGTPVRGHNLMPFSGNGLWYPILSQKDVNNVTSGPKLTPFMYADLTDLFYIL